MIGSLAALMVTYPSTHGVFEESIQDICAIVHERVIESFYMSALIQLGAFPDQQGADDLELSADVHQEIHGELEPEDSHVELEHMLDAFVVGPVVLVVVVAPEPPAAVRKRSMSRPTASGLVPRIAFLKPRHTSLCDLSRMSRHSRPPSSRPRSGSTRWEKTPCRTRAASS